MNFTGRRAFHGMSRSPRSTASMWGMPLPGASGAKRIVSQPVVHPTARPKRGSATQPQSGCAWRSLEEGEPHLVDAVDRPAEEHGQPSRQDSDGRGAGDLSRCFVARGRAVRSHVARLVRRVHNE